MRIRRILHGPGGRQSCWLGRRADGAQGLPPCPLSKAESREMSDVLVKFDEAVTDPSGARFFPQVVGRERKDGLWEGWIEFVSVDGARSIDSGRETSQPNRADLKYWAEGLTRAYLQGALGRAQSPTEAIRRDRSKREDQQESRRI